MMKTILAATAALLIAGCSGGDGVGPTPGPSVLGKHKGSDVEVWIPYTDDGNGDAAVVATQGYVDANRSGVIPVELYTGTAAVTVKPGVLNFITQAMPVIFPTVYGLPDGTVLDVLVNNGAAIFSMESEYDNFWVAGTMERNYRAQPFTYYRFLAGSANRWYLLTSFTTTP